MAPVPELSATAREKDKARAFAIFQGRPVTCVGGRKGRGKGGQVAAAAAAAAPTMPTTAKGAAAGFTGLAADVIPAAAAAEVHRAGKVLRPEISVSRTFNEMAPLVLPNAYLVLGLTMNPLCKDFRVFKDCKGAEDRRTDKEGEMSAASAIDSFTNVVSKNNKRSATAKAKGRRDTHFIGYEDIGEIEHKDISAIDRKRRLALISFGDVDPLLGVEHVLSMEKDVSEQELLSVLLRRAYKVLMQEITLLFGFRRCIFFSCPLNGWLTLEELDLQPAMLCPVCLRKCAAACGYFTGKMLIRRCKQTNA